MSHFFFFLCVCSLLSNCYSLHRSATTLAAFILLLFFIFWGFCSRCFYCRFEIRCCSETKVILKTDFCNAKGRLPFCFWLDVLSHSQKTTSSPANILIHVSVNLVSKRKAKLNARYKLTREEDYNIINTKVDHEPHQKAEHTEKKKK